MSEPENFLSRWSRRKLEAEREAPREPAIEKPEPARAPQPEKEDAAPAEASNAADAKANEPPKFDPATLPPIESIEAATDIRPFLQAGVPSELTRAALRRAWTSDPNIRDFIGIAE